ncbi:MAG: SURF1 family protein, partial [Rhizomicrobium sp.]
TIPMEFLGSAAVKAGDLNGPREIVGVIRAPAAPNWFTPPIEKDKRIVHTRDPETLAKAFGLKNVFPMFLEADAKPNPGGWPKGGVTVVDLPNNHLQYAITWFGLAIGLLGVYLVYHSSRGRLGLR